MTPSANSTSAPPDSSSPHSSPLTAPPSRYTAFEGHRRLAAGTLADVALAVKRAMAAGGSSAVLVFNDGNGHQTDLDLRGTDADILARHQPIETAAQASAEAAAEESPSHASPRGRGRPKLGVVPREVTLLPRHWDWLAAQPGGASVALRKLVEQARRDHEAIEPLRARQEAAYRFMTSLAGDLPGFEEATRALYAGDRDRYAQCLQAWPQDVRDYAARLAWPAGAAS